MPKPERPVTATEHAELAQLVGALWGSRCQIRTTRVARRRHDYLVASLTLTQSPGAVTIKLAGPTAPLACPFDRTAAILGRVRAQTAVPVPIVLAYDVSYRAYPWRYLLTTTLPGLPWSEAQHKWSPDQRRALWGELGGAVAALHAIGFPACGEIGPDGEVIDGGPLLAALAARARRRIVRQEHLALFLRLLDTHAAAFVGLTTGSLAHDDLNPTNLLVDRDGATGRWRLSGILDFDSAWAGSSESDLARLALWEGMTGAAFWSGYGLTMPLAADARQRRLLLQFLWCLEYAQPTARHHADTRRLCDALGIAPITFG